MTFDVRGSVHHSIIHKENPTRCNSVSEFYPIFTWSSTCFGRHTAHYQEPKTTLAASGFAYVEGRWTCSCWMLSGTVYSTWQRLPTLPLVLHTWRVVGRVVAGRCQVEYTLPDSVQQLHVQQPYMYAKPEAASAVLGSWWWVACHPKHVELHVNMK